MKLLLVFLFSLPIFAQTGASRLNTINNGPGTISRSVQSKLNDSYSFSDFGAVCDVGKPGVTTPHDNYPAWVAAYNKALTLGGMTLILPPSGYLCGVTSNLTIGNNAYNQGVGMYVYGQCACNNSGFIAMLAPGGVNNFTKYTDFNSSAQYTFLASIGGTNGTVATSYAKFMHMQLNGGGIIDTAAFSQSMQENTTFSDLLITNFKHLGLHAQGYGIQNVTWKDLTIYPSAGGSCIEIYSAISRPSIEKVTCNGGGTTSPGAILLYGGAMSIDLQEIHIENNQNGVVTSGTGYVHIQNIKAGPSVQGSTIYAQSGASLTVLNMTTSGYSLGVGITDCISKGCGTVGQNEPIYMAVSNGTNFAIGDPTLDTVFVYNGTVNSNGVWMGASLRATSIVTGYFQAGTMHILQDASGTAGAVMYVDTNSNGFMLQSNNVYHSFASGGAHILGNGFSSDPSLALFEGGVSSSDGAIWKAAGPTAQGMYQHGGTVLFYSNTGLTTGNTFTPNYIMSIDSNGIHPTVNSAGVPTSNPYTGPGPCPYYRNGICTTS